MGCSRRNRELRQCRDAMLAAARFTEMVNRASDLESQKIGALNGTTFSFHEFVSPEFGVMRRARAHL